MHRALVVRLGVTVVLAAALVTGFSAFAATSNEPAPVPPAAALEPTVTPGLPTPTSTPDAAPTATPTPEVSRARLILGDYIEHVVPILTSFAQANTSFSDATTQYGALQTEEDLASLRAAVATYNLSMQTVSQDFAALEPPEPAKPVHECFRESFELVAQGAALVEGAITDTQVDLPKLAEATSIINGAGDRVVTCTHMIQALKSELN